MDIKKIILALTVAVSATYAFAQEKAGDSKPAEYEFTVIKEAPVTSIKNQYRSGTCWCFSALSFLESEIIRMKGCNDIDLSEMFVVGKSYHDRGIKYVRLDGALGFSAGSSFGDVLHVVDDYGIVPQSAMSGMNYGTDKPEQSELDAVLEAYIKAVTENPNRKLTTAWLKGYDGIINAYLGEYPTQFEYNGASYTPESFRDWLGINADDYVNLTSFTHHPFYEPFIIEVRDNWRWDSAYNLPIDEFMEVMYNAIDKGYSVVWAADVSEGGFKWNEGFAVMPKEKNEKDLTGTELARWVKLSDRDRANSRFDIKGPVEEMEITPEIRQDMFDRQETTDDHGMVIVGKAVDQKGNKYYKVKNSWDTNQIYDGYFYVSEPYFLAKTLSILVNRNAIPAATAAKIK